MIVIFDSDLICNYVFSLSGSSSVRYVIYIAIAIDS